MISFRQVNFARYARWLVERGAYLVKSSGGDAGRLSPPDLRSQQADVFNSTYFSRWADSITGFSDCQLSEGTMSEGTILF
jgi:hypothetical protein